MAQKNGAAVRMAGWSWLEPSRPRRFQVPRIYSKATLEMKQRYMYIQIYMCMCYW
ncbi:hypothetical protein ALC57_12476 [Trachymyrmex cornetzi]|uniref:Uncharacterized protein n=1 Tax=Trachymyrmex cornetzi TaxID=471704 RepID=A0A195DRJ2_9HYME|nr:hypothetical protein ALC57_12476 [Trachymyrmex cornetzi]